MYKYEKRHTLLFCKYINLSQQSTKPQPPPNFKPSYLLPTPVIAVEVLRRTQRLCLESLKYYDGFSDCVWRFRTPTTGLAVVFGAFEVLQRA
jgi:hypothetical protein